MSSRRRSSTSFLPSCSTLSLLHSLTTLSLSSPLPITVLFTTHLTRETRRLSARYSPRQRRERPTPTSTRRAPLMQTPTTALIWMSATTRAVLPCTSLCSEVSVEGIAVLLAATLRSRMEEVKGEKTGGYVPPNVLVFAVVDLLLLTTKKKKLSLSFFQATSPAPSSCSRAAPTSTWASRGPRRCI